MGNLTGVLGEVPRRWEKIHSYIHLCIQPTFTDPVPCARDSVYVCVSGGVGAVARKDSYIDTVLKMTF